MIKDLIALLKDDKKLAKIANAGYIDCQKYLITNVKKEWIKLLKQL